MDQARTTAQSTKSFREFEPSFNTEQQAQTAQQQHLDRASRMENLETANALPAPSQGAAKDEPVERDTEAAEEATDLTSPNAF